MSTANAYYDSDDEDVCPLCCEPLDLADKNFIPCPCGYRVCMWCWHRIKENYTNLCPACRSTYSDDPHAFAAVDKDAVIKNENKKKQRAKQKDAITASAAAAATAAREHQHALHLRHHHQHQQHLQHLHREQVQQQQQHNRGNGGGASVPSNWRDLVTMRVVQRNVVCVSNLAPSMGSEEVLRKPQHFGQYGRIYKVTIAMAQGSDPRQASVSANITFAHKQDALACILAADGFWLEGRQVRASFGTSKYCTTYLRNSPCTNPDCLFMHELGEEEDRFTKDEVLQKALVAPPIPPGVPTATGQGGPSGTGKRCTGAPVFPPPVYEVSEGGSAGTAGSGTAGSGGAAQQLQGGGVQGGPAAAAAAVVPGGVAAMTAPASRVSISAGAGAGACNAWGGGARTNGASPRLGDDRAAGPGRRKLGGGVLPSPSPSASPHLNAHTSQRLAEEWPSLADTTAVAAPAPAQASQPTGRRNRRKKEKQNQ
ncbi:unnamed protein product, partial [Discosporangium mesarthrocarpum]